MTSWVYVQLLIEAPIVHGGGVLGTIKPLSCGFTELNYEFQLMTLMLSSKVS